MAGAYMFIMYASGNGNVTISPRMGLGEFMPQFLPTVKVELLQGSGMIDGKMVANFKCKPSPLMNLSIQLTPKQVVTA